MATYVMSDLHGCKSEFDQMLEKISFSPSDTMWIVGDICDRGTHSMELLLQIISMKNIHCIIGNHDEWLKKFSRELIIMKKGLYDRCDQREDYILWRRANSGDDTIEQFLALSYTKCMDILNYCKKAPYYQYLKLNGKQYLLVHAGFFMDHKKNFRVKDADKTEMIWAYVEIDDNPFDDCIMIVGHTPTFFYGRPYDGKICVRDKIIHIDCGCVYGRNLGCLRLDDMQEFYVPSSYPHKPFMFPDEYE